MMRKWTAIALIALMVLAMVGCGGGASPNTPTGAVENGVKALKEMNVTNLEKYFVDGGDLNDLGEEEKAQLDLMKALFTKLSVKVTKEEIDADDENYATVTADLTTIDAQALITGLSVDMITWATEHQDATEEESMTWLVDKIKSSASGASTTTVEGVEIYCEKVDGNWKVSDSYDNSGFFGAIMGGDILGNLF